MQNVLTNKGLSHVIGHVTGTNFLTLDCVFTVTNEHCTTGLHLERQHKIKIQTQFKSK
jgi:hypothetical protein